ncbi:STAS domain-containing protein [Nonomuraea sp. NPDC050536]|uniref:STAS domain-containing protein n=1 Tax=Nonomuraea sp. NPDC050536 TaxID=3364366 RepID=UPI0037CCAFC1
MTDLCVEVERAPRAALVRLEGDLDKVSAPAFRTCLAGLAEEGCVEVVVDAARLAFCDSSGLWVLVEHQRALSGLGGSLQLTGVQGVLLRVLDVTGLRPLFVSQL